MSIVRIKLSPTNMAARVLTVQSWKNGRKNSINIGFLANGLACGDTKQVRHENNTINT